PADPPPRRAKIALGGLILLAVLFLVVRALAPLLLAEFGARASEMGRRVAEGAVAATVLIIGVRMADLLAVRRIQNPATRYTIGRVLRLATAVLLAFITISVVFENWYTVAVSLGLASLILGFALQTPITSFIGWIYILLRTPFRVGDRIRIGEV